MMFVSMVTEGLGRLLLAWRITVPPLTSVHLIGVVSARAFVPAHRGVNLPHVQSLPCIWSFTKKLLQVEISPVWLFPPFSIIGSHFSVPVTHSHLRIVWPRLTFPKESRMILL